MANNFIGSNLGVSNTIQEFRTSVIQRKGPQIAGMYEVLMTTGYGETIYCYPQEVSTPGRTFKFYDSDIWGPVRKVPIKRIYSNCTMKFIIYQDWKERQFLETWMNNMVKNNDGSIVGSRDAGYNDYLSYRNTGQIRINFLNSNNPTAPNGQTSGRVPNACVLLKEAYPASLSQITTGADGSSYPSFTVTIEYNTYVYGCDGDPSVTDATQSSDAPSSSITSLRTI